MFLFPRVIKKRREKKRGIYLRKVDICSGFNGMEFGSRT